MNVGGPSNWDDFAELWKSETSSISTEELHRHARRSRANLIAIVIAELLSAAIGIATAAWLALATSMLYLGWGFGCAIAIFAAIVLRWQWRALEEPGEHSLKTLDNAVDRQDQIREFLRIGRAVMLAALLAVVMAGSAHLRGSPGVSLSGLLPLIASGVYLIAVLLCCTWIDRSARLRAAVYRRLREQLRGVNEPETNNARDGEPER